MIARTFPPVDMHKLPGYPPSTQYRPRPRPHPRERIRPIPVITKDILSRYPAIHPLQFTRERLDGTPDRHGDVLVWRPGLPEPKSGSKSISKGKGKGSK